MPGSSDPRRDLLFGILAIQNNFISQATLIAAFQQWTVERNQAMPDVLVNLKAISEADRDLLESLTSRHISLHSDDPHESLNAVRNGIDLPEDLTFLTDDEIEATIIGMLPPAPGDDAEAAQRQTVTVGASTSTGNRFRILRPHARGGIGEVYVALDQELQREVALKELQQRAANIPGSRARFALEAEITGSLQHPGIVPVYGLGNHKDGRPYYAMRFIKGESLRDAIAQFHSDLSIRNDAARYSLELRKLLRRFIDVCNAIEYAHGRGILHRDLKPANVMVGRYGETLVVDWGLAKATGQRGSQAIPDEATLVPGAIHDSTETMDGTAIGTPSYMSPEQANGQLDALSPVSDVYGLGATLYSILTGEPPFQGDSAQEVLAAVRKGEFPAPRSVNPAVDPALDAICRKAMALVPTDRYGSAADLSEDLERWMADEPVTAHKEPLSARLGRWGRRHRALVTGTSALFLTAFAALVIGAVLLNEANIRVEKQRELAEKKSFWRPGTRWTTT